MKNYLLFFCLSIATLFTLNAQELVEPITVTGQFNREYRTIHVSREIKNILFCHLRGELFYPKFGHFLELDTVSAHKLGLKDILVIPVGLAAEENLWYDYNKNVTMEVCRVLGDNYNVFYTKDESLVSSSQRDSGKDILKWSQMYPGELMQPLSIHNEDYRFTSELINLLDNATEVSYKTSQPSFDENNEFEEKIVYKKRRISEYALRQLLWLYATEMPPPKGIYTKQDWLTWYNSIPQPTFEKASLNLKYRKTPWSAMVRHTYLGKSFLQTKDDENIYALTPEGNFVMDVEKDTLMNLGDGSVNYKKMKWNISKEKKNKEVLSWRESEGGSFSFKHIELSNKDVLIAYIDKSKMEQSIKIFKMKKDSNQMTPKLCVDSFIPIENGYGSGAIGIMDLFEAKGKYYLIVNAPNANYWWTLHDKMFDY